MGRGRSLGVLSIVPLLLLLAVTSSSSQPLQMEYAFRLNADGSADVTITARMEGLGGRVDVTALAESLKANVSSWAESLTSEASKALGREVRIEGISVTQRWISTPRGDVLLVEVSFRMIGASKVSEGSIEFGDVFVGGTYLFEGDRLVVKAPEGYTISSVSPKPDSATDNEASWSGRRIIEGLRVVITKAEAAPIPAGPGPQQTGGHQTSPVPDQGLLILLAVAVLAVAVTILLFRGRRRAGGGRSSDVVRYLESRGGEALQSEIARDLGLSKSTASYLLQGLEASGLIVRERRGRDVVVRLRK